MSPQQNLILSYVSRSFPRGSIFFAEDLEFLPLSMESNPFRGSSSPPPVDTPILPSKDAFQDSSSRRLTLMTVRTVLSELAQAGHLIRPARGIYCYPRLAEGSLKVISPSPEEVAFAVAARHHVRIIPSGDEAAYLVGLTPLRVAPYTWFTEGAPQKISLSGGVTIRFIQRRSEKAFRFSSELFRNLVEGMKAVGKEGIDEGKLKVIEGILPEIGREALVRDYKLCPGWVRDILRGYL